MTTRYRTTAQELLAKAKAELDQGDLIQASEKGWGAAAQIIKAAAEARSWPHRSHGRLFDAARRLAEETGDDQISLLFHAASALHQNFYENWFSRDSVATGLTQVEELMRRVTPLIP